jgi:hypothetical protein
MHVVQVLNAAKSTFGPNLKILMCFFHVLKNVKEHLKDVDEKIKSEIAWIFVETYLILKLENSKFTTSGNKNFD